MGLFKKKIMKKTKRIDVGGTNTRVALINEKYEIKERVQFGKPVIKNQAMQFKVADMEIKTETARQMVAHALTKMDMGLPHSKEAAIAKCYASDIAMEVASEAIQMFGGYGYSREYPVEKLLRDAKIFQIFEGSNEIQRIVVANNTIGR